MYPFSLSLNTPEASPWTVRLLLRQLFALFISRSDSDWWKLPKKSRSWELLFLEIRADRARSNFGEMVADWGKMQADLARFNVGGEGILPGDG